jgi:tripartite-type tricarboxylate transporter receptor subunit TctC
MNAYKTAVAALLAALALHASPPAQAQQAPFPSKPVRIIVPYPAGGSTDVLARALANELAPVWKQPVVVENIGGASSIIGTERVAASAPDGHTLLFTIDPTVVGNRFLFKKLPYDPDKSLAPVTIVARSGNFIIAHPSFPASTLREMVELVRRSPGKVAYSSYGVGSHSQLVFETMAKREGLQFLHVPYKGIAPSTQAVVAGEVQLSIGSPAATGTMVKAGRLRAISITGPNRASRFPDVQTSAEGGFPYVKAIIWFGLFAPGGADPKLVDRIYQDVTAIAKRPDFTEKHIDSLSLELVASTPAETAATIRDDVEHIGEMVKAAGVKPE